ncbi:MAG: sensor domain-containing diguanylate cyclase, partial [Burkholderiaceae bacterium]
MTRLPTPSELDAPASPAIRDEAVLLDVARHLPGCLFELKHDPASGYRVGFVGDGIRALLGLDPATVRADPGQVLAMVAADDRLRLAEAMARCAREQACWHDEVRLRTADGRDVWLSIEARPSAGAAGEVCWHGWCHATTERHAAWAALVDSEQRHRRLFDANPMPMWVHDRLTLRFLTVNEAATARYGWSREEFLRMTLVDLRHPGPDDAAESGTTGPASEPTDTTSAEPPQAGAADGTQPATAHHRLKNGQLIEVELTSQPITWNGRPARMVMAIDVTDRRRAEAEIQRLAYYDTLTGLPNRRLLADRMRQSISAALRSG